MLFVRFFAKNSYLIIVVVLASSLFGIFALSKQKLKLKPTSNYRFINITTTWDDQDPLTIELKVTSIIENIASNLKGIRNIESISTSSMSKVFCSLDKYTDANLTRLEVASAIRVIYQDLPTGVSFPVISTTGFDLDNERPVIGYAFTSAREGYETKHFVDSILMKDVHSVPGLKKIEFTKVGRDNIVIKLKPESVRFNIQLRDITAAIKEFSEKVSIGIASSSMSGNNTKLSIKCGNEINQISDLYNIVVKNINGKLIFLWQVADVSVQPEKMNSYYRIVGKDAVSALFYCDDDYSDLKFVSAIKSIMESGKIDLPDDFSVIQTFDSTTSLSNEIRTIFLRLAITLLILLLFIAMISKNGKYLLTIILSLLANISIAFIFYYLLDVELHFYTLAGITISLGIVIDNSIMMADHLLNQSNIKVIKAILASTLTSIASVMVIFLLPEEDQLNLADFARVIAINLIVSLGVSLFFIPAMMHVFKLYKKDQKLSVKKMFIISGISDLNASVLRRLIKRKMMVVLLLVLMFGIPVYNLPAKINHDNAFAGLYNLTFGTDYYYQTVRPVIVRLFGGSMYLFNEYVTKGSYNDIPNETKIVVKASLPDGFDVKQLNSVLLEVEDYLFNFKQDIRYITKVTKSNIGTIEISFPNKNDDELAWILKNKLITFSTQIGGVYWSIYGQGSGFSNLRGENEFNKYKILISGYNYFKLNEISDLISSELRKYPRVFGIKENLIPYTHNVTTTNELNLLPNNCNTDMYGVANMQILNHLSEQSINNKTQLEICIGGTDMKVNINSNSGEVTNWDLFNNDADSILISNFLNFSEKNKEDAIWKENQNYKKIVEFKYNGSMKGGQLYCDRIIREIQNKVPIGFNIEQDSYSLAPNENFDSYSYLLAVVILLIFVICSILFESIKYSFYVLLIIPSSFIGIFLIFYFMDLRMDSGGYASFLMVSGLVVNSSIYLINEMKCILAQKPGENRLSIFLIALRAKIVPILLTLISTIIGLLPFVLISKPQSFWTPLAAGTIGGLLFSIVVLLFVLPVFIIPKRDC